MFVTTFLIIVSYGLDSAYPLLLQLLTPLLATRGRTAAGREANRLSDRQQNAFYCSIDLMI